MMKFHINKLKPCLIFLLIFYFFIHSVSYSQNSNKIFTDTLKINSLEFSIIESEFVIDSILSVHLINLPEQNFKFLFNRLNQSIKFFDKEILNQTIVLKYSVTSIKRKKYQKNIPVIIKDTTEKPIRTVIQKSQYRDFGREIFGSRVQRSGSIVRGFSVGSNKDFTLNSGLRLQLAGQLSDEVEIVTVLSDQNSPIQPEGNTRTLQEIDNVYIELKHKNFQGTFGDYFYNYRSGTFGLIDRKLQGLKSTFLLDSKNYSTVAYATARGKFKSQQFNGIDGVQGPYRLTGENNERDIIVIAGTEKVFINGEEKIRGENFDYTIDYSTGEIFFTPRVIITNASRIKVDFEYSDRKFERNFLGASAFSSLFENRFSISASYFREGDNPSLPVDVSLSEEDKRILAQSGNDRYAASKSGIKFVGVDSTGKPAGIYRLRDTLINNVKIYFYEYDPGGDSSFYNVSFSFVGDGNGDYVRIGLGRFKFVGKSQGNYSPIIFLPMPELKQVASFHSRLLFTKQLFLEGEFSFSSFDRNRFSQIDDDKNKGKAYSVKIGVDSSELNLFSEGLGSFSLNFYSRKIEASYSPMQRIFEAEYERNWNLGFVTQSTDEILNEINFSFFRKDLNSNLSFGNMRRGNVFKANKFIVSTDAEIIDQLKMIYLFSNLNSKINLYNSNYNKQTLSLSYTTKFLNPFLKLEYENKIDKYSLTDSTIGTSFRFYDFILGVLSDVFRYIQISSSFNFRQDYFPLSGRLFKESNSYIYQFGLKTKNLSNVSSSLDLSYREKKYSKNFIDIGRLNNNSLAIKYLGRGAFFDRFLQLDLYYEAASQRSSKLERIFLRVQKGSGNYIYKGDLNNNGVADEFEFEPTRFDGDYILTTYPTYELFPVTDLKASTRIKFNFNNLRYSSGILNFIKPISTETYLRIEENSLDQKVSNIYLLRFKTFRNPSTTLRGNYLVQHDINLFEYDPDFNILFRITDRKGFSKYSITDEIKFQQDKLIRVRYKPLKDFANQTDLTLSKNFLTSTSYTLRNFQIRTTNVATKFFYYPFKNVEAGFKLEFGNSLDNLTQTKLNSNSQQISLTIMYAQKGKIYFDAERTELIINKIDGFLPFELTKGYIPGKNYLWNFSLDYQITDYLQSRATYNGRNHTNKKIIHTATAEVRAYF